VEGWIRWVFGPGCSLYSRFFGVDRSFIVACFVCWLGILSELVLHVRDNGWDLGDTEMTVRRRRMAVEENSVLCKSWLGNSCGGKTAPTTTKRRD